MEWYAQMLLFHIPYNDLDPIKLKDWNLIPEKSML